MLRYWWVPLVVVDYAIAGWLWHRINVDGTWRSVWLCCLVGLVGLPLWPIVAKYSRSLVADALIFDVLLLVSSYGAMLVAGSWAKLGPAQWIGLALCLTGLVIVKAGG